VRDFVADRARAGKSFTEIKKKTWKLPMGTRARVLGNDTELLSRQGACHGARHLLLKKTVRTAILIALWPPP
jgi:hypothetical protein